jgi:hypothetical protein
MFGHQDNQTDTSDQAAATDDAQDKAAAAVADQVHLDPPSTMPSTGSSDAPADPNRPQATEDSQPWQHPGKALGDDKTKQTEDVISPAGGFPQALSSKEPVLSPLPVPAIGEHAHLNLDTDENDDNKLTEATNDELIHVKQEALDELFPLIDKLDQTPDEHFKTLMMIIQASDNHALIEKAFQIAQTIDDEKIRAQALLDIVNEINYFTQQPKV